MELIPQEIRAKIPRLGEASEESDPMVWAKLVAAQLGWTWYIIEMQPVPPDAIFYGYAVGWDETLEYFNLAELEQIAAVEGVTLASDPAFEPRRLSVVRAQERGPAKFPFGQVVATPGAVAAFEQAGDHPFLYLQRHAHGDWGDLDTQDVAESEFSLVNGLRLLSAYTLSDGTLIWIITEADRSVTTLLLPEEY
jgi:Protein of unknown function (DUF2958)